MKLSKTMFLCLLLVAAGFFVAIYFLGRKASDLKEEKFRLLQQDTLYTRQVDSLLLLSKRLAKDYEKLSLEVKEARDSLVKEHAITITYKNRYEYVKNHPIVLHNTAERDSILAVLYPE